MESGFAALPISEHMFREILPPQDQILKGGEEHVNFFVNGNFNGIDILDLNDNSDDKGKYRQVADDFDEQSKKEGDEDGECVAEDVKTGRLYRGLSKTMENEDLVQNARRQMTNGLAQRAAKEDLSVVTGAAIGHSSCHIETPSYTFTLPDLTAFPEDFQQFLEKDLIEISTLKSLEERKCLNWWASSGVCEKLWPLATSGDGNCLLHAASLGMWGFHDRLLMLRKALHYILTKGSRRHALWRRWRWHQTQVNNESGLVYAEEEWAREWEVLVRLASAQPRKNGANGNGSSGSGGGGSENRSAGGENRSAGGATSTPARSSSSTPLPNQAEDAKSTANSEEDLEPTYESLEELHVFALAHVLKRPIVVIADTMLFDSNGDPMAPIPFGGIYLPLECHPSECHRSPLVLSYDAAHFSALVLMQNSQQTKLANGSGNGKKGPHAIVPITDADRHLLPIHFESDPGPDFSWWKDNEDHKIAAFTGLTDEARLDMIASYMDILKVPLESATESNNKGNTMPAAGTKTSHPPLRSTNSDGNLSPSTKTKSTTIGNIGKKIRKKLAKNFTITINEKKRGPEKGSWSSRKTEPPPLTLATYRLLPNSRRPSRCPLVVDDFGDRRAIVGVRLNCDHHHQFMGEMIENYLQSARKRFEEAKSAGERLSGGTGGTGDGSERSSARQQHRRERISRSISASSLVVKCMNGSCEAPASHATNFLCDVCFDHQKQLMESFSVAKSPSGGEYAPVRAVGVDTRPQYDPPPKVVEPEEPVLNLARSTFYTTVPKGPAVGSMAPAAVNGCRNSNFNNAYGNNQEESCGSPWKLCSGSGSNSPKRFPYSPAKFYTGDNLQAAANKKLCPNPHCQFPNGSQYHDCRLCGTKL